VGRLQRKKTTAGKKKKKTGPLAPKPDAPSDDAVQNDAHKLKVVKKPPPAVAKKETTTAKSTPAKDKQPNFYQKSVQFLREVKVELKKVTWPSRKQTIGSTVVVVIIVMIIGFFLGAVDIGLSSLVKVVLQ
jgi:preprotein translocase subunit SecE